MSAFDRIRLDIEGALIARARRDEKVVERWILSGMEGHLVKDGVTGGITIEDCEANESGDLTIYVRIEGGGAKLGPNSGQ